MSRKVKQIVARQGYFLHVNLEGKVGSKYWEKRGFLFNTRLEADNYRKKFCSHVGKYRIEGVYMNIEPIRGIGDKGE